MYGNSKENRVACSKFWKLMWTPKTQHHLSFTKQVAEVSTKAHKPLKAFLWSWFNNSLLRVILLTVHASKTRDAWGYFIMCIMLLFLINCGHAKKAFLYTTFKEKISPQIENRTNKFSSPFMNWNIKSADINNKKITFSVGSRCCWDQESRVQKEYILLATDLIHSWTLRLLWVLALSSLYIYPNFLSSWVTMQQLLHGPIANNGDWNYSSWFHQ